MKTSSSLSKWRSQIILELVEDMEQYSTIVDDLETLLCFLHLLIITEFPKKINLPVLDP